FFFFQAEDGIRDKLVTGVQTCALPISHLRLRQASEQLADEFKHAGVRGRVRRRRIADRVLVDVDHLVDLLQAQDVVVGGGRRPRSEERRVGKGGRSRWAGCQVNNNRAL